MKHNPLLVGNWKMYPTVSEGIIIANGVKKALESIHHIEVVLCPPAVMLSLVHDVIFNHKLPNLELGCQNIYYQDEGPFTGEISAAMVKGLAKYVIVGHSERVKWFHETPHETNRKIEAALQHNLIPIVCVGEDQKSQESAQEAVNKLSRQLLNDLSKNDLSKIIVAYEPIWAISSGKVDPKDAATGEYAGQVAKAIRQVVAPDTRIIYGGSTNPDNIADFLSQDDIDGALVGGESVKLADFITMCGIVSGLK